MKHLGCLILVAIMLLLTIPALADNISGPYTYEVKGNGTATITSYNWEEYKYTGEIFIPTMIDGYTVTGIGDEAFKGGDIYSSGDNYDEEGPKYQIKVVLPDTIKSIGNKAFFDASITEINLPNSVQYIGSGAFADCPFLHFIVSQNHPYFAVIDKALYSKANKELLCYPSCYQGYEKLVIPEGITSIGDYALYRAYKYNFDTEIYVSLPTTIKKIGDYAFSEATLYIPENFFPEKLESLGIGTFYNTEVDGKPFIIPSAVASIGEACFSGIGDATFIGHPTSFRSITIPSDSALTIIPACAFQGCEFSIRLYSSNIERIEDFAFDTGTPLGSSEHGLLYPLNTENEVDYSLFENLKYIGISALSYRAWPSNESAVAEADDKTFPAQISTINAHFNFDILIPPSVHTIEANAYDQVVNDFYLPTTLTQISPEAFAQGSTFIVEAGSYAELWALENGFDYSIEGQDNLDWLNN